MEKIFKALEILERALEFNDEGEFQSGRLWRIIFNDMVDDNDKSIIEQALVELKTLKEANPTEAMKCLKNIGETNLGDNPYKVFEENKLKKVYKEDFTTIEQALIQAEQYKTLGFLLEAKKNGFYDTLSFWKPNEFVVDYDFIKNDYCLRSIRNNDTLGKTKFYAKDHKKTWWLKKDKSE